ncbi:glycosyltransferase [Candidatus Daviesbacteria bacterium]|nr:glycosyltransferase [Candidatus Daviesbacteria bacterium]
MEIFKPVKVEALPVMDKEDKITYLFMVVSGMIITSIFGIWWFLPSHIPNNFSGFSHIFDIIIFTLLSYIVWHQLIMEMVTWYLSFTMKIPKPLVPQAGLRVAFLTAFVPGKESYEMLAQTLKAMTEVDYPHDTWLLDEGDDLYAKAICYRYGVKHFSRKGTEKYNQPEGKFKAKTKGGNYNAWFDVYSNYYDIVAQHDVDFIPHKQFLTRTLGYFRDPEVAFVGTPQIYGNQDASWIVRGAAEQSFNFYGPIQKGLFGAGTQFFIGANHVVRVTAQKHIGGYSGHIVEDHLTGMRIYANKWKSVYVPEVLAIGEGPATWDAYFSQQMRWAYGIIDILFRHSPKILPKMKFKHALNYFLMQQYYFTGIAQGIGVILLVLYFLFGIEATGIKIIELIILSAPLLVIQLMIFYYLQGFNIDPKNESGFFSKSKLLNFAAWPIYLTAFFSVLLNKRLTYKVTPKGSMEKGVTSFTLFIPHIVLGTLTIIGIIASFFTGNQAPQLMFFAALNSVTMYFFMLMVIKEQLQAKINFRLLLSLLSINIFDFKPKELAYTQNVQN